MHPCMLYVCTEVYGARFFGSKVQFLKPWPMKRKRRIGAPAPAGMPWGTDRDKVQYLGRRDGSGVQG